MKRALRLIVYGLAGILVTAGLTAAAFAVAGNVFAQPPNPIGLFKTPAEVPSPSGPQNSRGDQGTGKDDHASPTATPGVDDHGGGSSGSSENSTGEGSTSGTDSVSGDSNGSGDSGSGSSSDSSAGGSDSNDGGGDDHGGGDD